MKTVEVDVAALRTIVEFFYKKPTIAPDVVKSALVSLTQALNGVPLEGVPFMEGYRVKPKSGRNYLRAGITAYGDALVVSVKPFVIISFDGRHVWEGLDQDLFDMYDRIEGRVHDALILLYDDYMKKKGS